MNGKIKDQKISFFLVEDLISGIKPDLETANLPKDIKENGDDDIFNRTGNRFDNTYLSTLLELSNDKNNKTFFNKLINGLRQKLDGQIIVDLGSGSTNLGYCSSLIFGASKYIAVEKFSDIVSKLIDQLKKIEIKDGEILLNNLDTYDGRKILVEQKGLIDKLIPVSIVHDKILHFLKRLPDNSVSILTSGINYALIDNTEYRDAIGLEIERVLDPNGLYISRSSDIKTENLLILNDLSDDVLQVKVFNKRKE